VNKKYTFENDYTKTKTRDRRKLPHDVGWVIGAILGTLIWLLCTYVLVDIGSVMGVILGFGSGMAFAVFIEDLHQDPLTPGQQKKLEWVLISGIITLIIGILLFTLFNVIR